jgi:hypothetical protein
MNISIKPLCAILVASFLVVACGNVITRHNEINEYTAKAILKEAGGE